MSSSPLPERASLEYLKKLAKDRLQELRRTDPRAQLATALLLVAREHGFASWRALKAEVDSRHASTVTRFFDACARGDVETLRPLLAADASLARAAQPGTPHGGWTALHLAAKRGDLAVVRLLLEHGADPNAREAGDNTTPLHWSAAYGHLEATRALLDGGGDVHGFGDVHALDLIGWATGAGNPPSAANLEVVSLLLARGARHHIFSAIAVGELARIQSLVEQNPDALDRRMSRFEQGQTPLHFAIARHRYDIADLLITLGADLEAGDASGHTPLVSAMLRGDQEAMRLLHAAGAIMPAPAPSDAFTSSIRALAGSVTRAMPMITVPDIGRTLAWYLSIGFTEIERFEDDGVVNFGMVELGQAQVMFNVHGTTGPHDVSLWFYTDRVDELYQSFKSRQLDAARAALETGAEVAGTQASGGRDEVVIEQEIEDMFYGARQFSIRDPNGYVLYFIKTSDA